MSKYTLRVLAHDRVSTCTDTLTSATSPRDVMCRTPAVAAASILMSSLHRASAWGNATFVSALAGSAEVAPASQAKEVICSFLLSQHGVKRNFAPSLGALS